MCQCVGVLPLCASLGHQKNNINPKSAVQQATVVTAFLFYFILTIQQMVILPPQDIWPEYSIALYSTIYKFIGFVFNFFIGENNTKPKKSNASQKRSVSSSQRPAVYFCDKLKHIYFFRVFSVWVV